MLQTGMSFRSLLLIGISHALNRQLGKVQKFGFHCVIVIIFCHMIVKLARIEYNSNTRNRIGNNRGYLFYVDFLISKDSRIKDFYLAANFYFSGVNLQ